MSRLEHGHVEPELIALLALGEQPGSSDQDDSVDRHLAACGLCRSEVDELGAVVSTARRTQGDGALVPPPASVWAGITEALAADTAMAPVTVLADRRRRRSGWITVAAAACAGAVLGGGAVYSATSTQRGTAPTTVIAAAALAPLAGSSASGSVEVVSSDNGPRVHVDVTGLAAANGFYEVWLLDKDGKKLIALGVLDDTATGEFAMPPGVSMADYPVVDVSLEPSDGNPGHSHNSLVRGTLPA